MWHCMPQNIHQPGSTQYLGCRIHLATDCLNCNQITIERPNPSRREVATILQIMAADLMFGSAGPQVTAVRKLEISHVQGYNFPASNRAARGVGEIAFGKEEHALTFVRITSR